MIKIYTARGMTHRIKEEVVQEAADDATWLRSAGFTVLCPVERENVEPTKQVLRSSRKAMESYWPEDKRMIREAHVVFDMSPHLNSEGTKHELGYARYFLWMPVVRIFPYGKLPISSSVARFEDDYICDSLEEATEYVYRTHGTWFKRFVWRLNMYKRCRLKALVYEIMGWFK